MGLPHTLRHLCGHVVPFHKQLEANAPSQMGTVSFSGCGVTSVIGVVDWDKCWLSTKVAGGTLTVRMGIGQTCFAYGLLTAIFSRAWPPQENVKWHAHIPASRARPLLILCFFAQLVRIPNSPRENKNDVWSNYPSPRILSESIMESCRGHHPAYY